MDNTQVWNHYALIDPRIDDAVMQVRYVGRTVKAVDRRYREHLSNTNRGCSDYRSNWIRKMLREGVDLVVVFLGQGDENFETELIALYREHGAKLTNGTDGGEGVVNPSPEVRAKHSAASKAVHARPEVKAKMSAAAKVSYIRNARPEVESKQREWDDLICTLGCTTIT